MNTLEIRPWFGVFLLGLLPAILQAEALIRHVVPISATASSSPTAQITLSWTPDAFATNWVVYRRNADVVGGVGNWTVTNAISAGTTYADASVSVGCTYEYGIVKKGWEGTNFIGAGYILAGIEAPAIENRGKLVLIVDSRFTIALEPELARLENDLAGDGWEVLRHDVDKALTVNQIKALIRADYAAGSNNVKSVFLFGDLAVPYSGVGSFAAITHGTETRGAQPADLYYGDMDGFDGSDWTDTGTEADVAIYKHHNLPGDGKFDQTHVPGDGPTNWPGPADGIVELEVGRVDLSDMPAFQASETELMRRYLNKDHDFRHRNLVPLSRALLIPDDTSTASLDFYRNLTPMLGPNSTFTTGMYVPVLADPDPSISSYLWAGGFGNGQRECIAGIVTSTDHAINSMNAVFTIGFSSYWHDFDVENSLYRAPLAGAGAGLVRLYARGVWFLHEMGLGRNIGSAVRRSQSQDWERVPLYSEPISFSGKVSVYSLLSTTYGSLYHSLMGDPTLRISYVAPPTHVAAVSNYEGGVTLSWDAPAAETVAGYHVYRQDGGTGPFARMDNVGAAALLPPGTRSFTDPSPYAGQSVYMVRAIRLESCASGSFHNPSQGVTVAYPIQWVQLAETTDGVAAAPRALARQTYQTLQAGSPPASGGPYVCTWAGTGSVPSGGRGSNVTVLLDQASAVAWSWTTNHASTVNVLAPVQGGTYKPSADVVIRATATDVDGQIARVEFRDENQNLLPGTYNTGNRNLHNPNPATSSYYDWVWDGNGSYFATWYVDAVLGKLYWSNQPYVAEYKYTWKNPPSGNHAVTIKVYDILGGVTVLPPVSFTVGAPVAPLTITTQPLSQTADVGQRATFSVVASGGTLPYAYTWKWNTIALSAGWGDSYTAFPASPKHHYTTTYDANNGASYSVVVTDALNNSVTSDVAVLTVNIPPPTIVTPPLDQSVLDNQTATFAVVVSAVVPASGLLYQWQKQAPAGSWSNINLATNAAYAATVTTNDSGNLYRVTVSHKTDYNGDGYWPGSTTSSVALLTVTVNAVAPAITAQPTNQTVFVGQTTAFSVAASGTAPLYYQWRTNGSAIGGATGASYTTPATGISNSGDLYSVIVSNALGSVTSVTATLTVTLAAPAITAQPTNQTVFVGQTAAFSVAASGTAPLGYQWRTNGIAVSGAVGASHTTPATSAADSGKVYSVVVSNDFGSVTSSSAVLTVNAAAVPAVAGLPFRDSFETYALGAGVSGTNGWGGAVNASSVTALSYQVKRPPGYPIPFAAHGRVLHISSLVSNAVAGVSNQNVGVDFMVRPTRGELPASPGSTVQMALCVDTQGVAQVWHLYDNGGTWIQRWTALGNPPLATTRWVRVSVALDYSSNGSGHTLFRPALDGVPYATAYGVADPTNLTTPGSWYVCANSPGAGAGGTPRISVFGVKGDVPCLLDDLVVTTDPFAYTLPNTLLMVR